MTETAGRFDLGEDIERSAAPAEVRAASERLLETQPGLEARLATDRALRRALVAVVAASRSLTRLIEIRPETIDVLADLDSRPPVTDANADELADWKQLEYLRIAARDLTGVDDLEETGAALARLAADVLGSACLIAGTSGLAVIGMGKLGGHELNYSSDIDVIFVGDGPPERLDSEARAVMEIARRCFRVDANLRPEGRDGPLVRSLDSYEAYWERWAEPWEFQALLKAVPVAGDQGLGRRWFDAAQRWLWTHPFTADDLRAVRALKARTEAEVARRGLADREIKRGPGGIRDIEFTVQILQLVHGHADRELRSPTTLTTLTEMAEAGYVDTHDAEHLASAYRYLRRVEHYLQLVDEQQIHTLPTDPEARNRLARVLGYRDTVEGSATEQLQRDLRQQQLTVRTIHERVYFRPLLEAFAVTKGGLSPEAAAARLAAFGFVDARRTQAAVRELTRGLNRTSRLMQQLLPLLLDWLSRSPDPDLGLLEVRNLLVGPQRQQQLIEAFRDAPDVAQRLCTIVGTSRLLGEILVHNPDLVTRLPYDEQLRTRPRDELVASAIQAVAWRDDQDERQDALKRWKDRNLLGIAARDVLGFADIDTVGRDLTALAEATLEAALLCLEPQIPFAVVGMGRFGGGELSYASDLDLLFVYEGTGMQAVAEANRIASRLMKFVGGSTPADRIFEMDADLRPEGKAGALARSLEGYRTYWDDSAQTWERLAMIRARTVAGAHDLGERLLDTVEPAVWHGGLDPEELRDLRKIKARVERERIPPNEDPQFHLKLGRGSLSDIEFTVQTMQLQFALPATGTAAALGALAATDVLATDDADALTESYRFCELLRNRWFLVNSAPGDSLPTQPEQLTWLARSLDTTAGELREHYRRVTRRARRVVERIFYGQP